MVTGCTGSPEDKDANVSEPNCRNAAVLMRTTLPAATAASFPNVVGPIEANCEFNEQLRQYTCRASYIDNLGQPAELSKTWMYDSVADFVREGAIMGHTTSRKFTVSDSSFGPIEVIPDRPIQGTNSFDETGKLISSGNTIFNAWDTQRRPIMADATGICTDDQGRRYVYDDAAREMTVKFNTRTLTRPPDGTVPCIQAVQRTRFDGQGNVNGIDDRHYEILKTKWVCS